MLYNICADHELTLRVDSPVFAHPTHTIQHSSGLTPEEQAAASTQGARWRQQGGRTKSPGSRIMRCASFSASKASLASACTRSRP